MWSLLLFPLLLAAQACLTGECEVREIVFTRLRFRTDSARMISVKLHVRSPESAPLHAVLKFASSIGAYHSAVLIDTPHMKRYAKIKHSSRFEYNNKLTIITKDVHLNVDYRLVATPNGSSGQPAQPTEEASLMAQYLSDLYETWTAIGPTTGPQNYDGVLSLAPHSSLWRHYNVMVFERHKLRLLYRREAALDTALGHYSGIVRLQCDAWITPRNLSHLCLVARVDPTAGQTNVSFDRYTPDGVASLEVNGRAYANYRVRLDFESAINQLPLDLFLVWYAASGSGRHLRIKLYDSAVGDGSNFLYLNGEFEYQLGETEDVVLGRDLVHLLPRLEYAMDRLSGTRTIHLWYMAADVDPSEQHEAVGIFFMFMLVLTLFCLFVWGTISNYYVTKYIILLPHYARQYHLFAYKQTIFELLILVVAGFLWILTIVFSQAATSDQQTLMYCLLALGAYHALLLVVVMVLTPQVNEKIRNYFKKPPVTRDGGATITMLGQAAGQSGGGLSDLDLAIGEIEDEHTREIFSRIPDVEERRIMHGLFMPNYNDRLVKESTPQTLVRCLAFVVLIVTNLLLIFNFDSADNRVFLLLIVILSITLLFFIVKYLTLGVVFLMFTVKGGTQALANAFFILFLLLETAVLFLYLVFSFDATYMVYFMAANTIYSETVVRVLCVCLLGSIFVASIYTIYRALDTHREDVKRERRKNRLRQRLMASSAVPIVKSTATLRRVKLL